MERWIDGWAGRVQWSGEGSSLGWSWEGGEPRRECVGARTSTPHASTSPIHLTRQAVGKYNASDTPAVLEKVRHALCLAEQSSEQVHNAMYDAQLAMMLPADDDEESKFTDDKMQLLGELEGILQVLPRHARWPRCTPYHATPPHHPAGGARGVR